MGNFDERQWGISVSAVTLAALALSGCDGVDAGASTQEMAGPATATVNQMSGAMPPVPTDLPPAAQEWAGGSNGTALFSVGTHAKDGFAAAIPPGRYEVRLAPGAEDGGWMLCDTASCGPVFQENATVVGRPIGPTSSAMYIGPQSRTLWLNNVILIPAAD